MIKQFSDMKSLNTVFMFKYMFCNTQNLTLLISAKFSFWMTDMEKNTLIWIDRAILALPLVKFSFTKCYYKSQTNSVMGGELCLECTTVCEVR